MTRLCNSTIALLSISKIGTFMFHVHSSRRSQEYAVACLSRLPVFGVCGQRVQSIRRVIYSPNLTFIFVYASLDCSALSGACVCVCAYVLVISVLTSLDVWQRLINIHLL